MKLSELRKDRDYYTEKLSEIVRQLDFAGIAIIWIFRTGGDDSAGIAYDRALVMPMGCLVLSLVCDLLHYCWGSLASELLYRSYDKRRAEPDTEVRFSRKIPFVTRILFWTKTAFAMVAFVLLIGYICTRL